MAPIAGILLNHKVVTVFYKGSGAFNNGHSFQGHPTARAAALEEQSAVRDQGLIRNVKRMRALLLQCLRERLGHHAHVGDIQGRGLFCTIEFVNDKQSKATFKGCDENSCFGVTAAP